MEEAKCSCIQRTLQRSIDDIFVIYHVYLRRNFAAAAVMTN